MSLVADLTLSGERLESTATWVVAVDVRNDGDRPIRFSTSAFAGPIAFEVRDAAGERVPLGPPPVPPDDFEQDAVTLEPAGTLSLRFPGHELMPDPPPPGAYRLRFAGHAVPVADGWTGVVESPWVDFTVA